MIVSADELCPGDRVIGYPGDPFPVGVLTVDHCTDHRQLGVRLGPRVYWRESRGFTELQRSGTWSTIRAAQRQKTPLVIIWPDGSTKETGL